MLAMKLAVYCWPGAGFTYPLGSGNKPRIAFPVGSIKDCGIRLLGNCTRVAGSRMGMTVPAEFRVFEKSPFRSASVGMLAVLVEVGCAIRVNSWETKKNNRRRSVFHFPGIKTGPPKL